MPVRNHPTDRLFLIASSFSMLESNINAELNNIHIWLCANKLSLNVEKSNFVIFHAPQKKLECQNFMLAINNKQLKREFCIRYLGILIDSHLNWKHHVECIVKKIRRSIGILSKLRYYVGLDILLSLYYALIYPFLTYGIIIWGNTYKTTLQPIFILQKRAMRLITFSRFDEHSSPLFKSLEIIKFLDLVTFHLAILCINIIINYSGAPNDNFRKNICSEDNLRSRIFGTFFVKFIPCLPLLGFSNI